MSLGARLIARAWARSTLLARISPATVASLPIVSRPLAAGARFYSENKKPSSLLSDDILAKAGMDPVKETSSAAESEPSSSSSSSSSSSQSPHTTEEQRQRWKGTAKKATSKTTTDLRRERNSNYFYLACLGALIGGSIYLARDWDDEEDLNKHPEIGNGYTPGLLWGRLSARVGDVFGYFKEPVFEKLLPDPLPAPYGRPFTLVVGLDDVLVHSEWSRQHGWRTAKRPGVDYFLGYLAQYYEVVVFSSNYMIYSDKIVPKLDPYRASVSHVIYREGTVYRDGKIIKDLSKLNRDLDKVIMIDCREDSFAFQPENGIPLKPWEGNADDKELVKLIPFLEWLATQPIKDVRPILNSFEGKYIPDEYARREALVRKKFEEDWHKEQEMRSKNDWASAFLGVKAPVQSVPMMPQDYIRQEGQKGYEQFQKYIQEHGEQFLKEEKEREQQFMSENKFTLGKYLTEGAPKPEDLQSAAEAEQKPKEQTN